MHARDSESEVLDSFSSCSCHHASTTCANPVFSISDCFDRPSCNWQVLLVALSHRTALPEMLVDASATTVEQELDGGHVTHTIARDGASGRFDCFQVETFGIRSDQFRAHEEDLRGVVGPEQNYEERPSGLINGTHVRASQIHANHKLSNHEQRGGKKKRRSRHASSAKSRQVAV